MTLKYCEDCDIEFDQSDGCPRCDDGDCGTLEEYEKKMTEQKNETLISHISTIKHDAVNHPKHYTSHPSGVECIDIARHMGFNLGNALKYLWRCDLKHDSPVEDLEKAIFYINDEIEFRKKRNDRSNKS